MSDSTLFPGGAGGPPSPAPRRAGRARFQAPVRDQVQLLPSDLDGLLPPDHRARLVWEFVEGLDLSPYYEAVRAVEGGPGRPPVDPAILLALWLHATLEGVGSARAVERLCGEHDAYRWICGGVSLNHHTLSDFRCGHGEKLDRLLSESVAAMAKEGLVDLDCVAIDGVRVRAEAGGGSFRRKATLEELLGEAQARVAALREEVDDDPAAASRRQRAARERAAEERAGRVRRALAEREKVAQVKGKDARRRGAAGDARASTTDPEARAMKMADGGSRPAYNAQFCTAAGSQVIVGVEATNQGNDVGLLDEMIDQIERRHGRLPRAALVDGGFVKYDDIERLGRRGTLTYSPVPVRRCDRRAPHEPHDGDGPAVAEWRSRMGTPAGRQVYGRRAPTAECVNALARNRGLRRVFVRGLKKVRSVMLLFALAHNLVRAAALRAGAAAAA
jgi:transposase